MLQEMLVNTGNMQIPPREVLLEPRLCSKKPKQSRCEAHLQRKCAWCDKYLEIWIKLFCPTSKLNDKQTLIIRSIFFSLPMLITEKRPSKELFCSRTGLYRTSWKDVEVTGVTTAQSCCLMHWEWWHRRPIWCHRCPARPRCEELSNYFERSEENRGTLAERKPDDLIGNLRGRWRFTLGYFAASTRINESKHINIMTHSRFDYSAKPLGEIGPRSAQSERRESLCGCSHSGRSGGWGSDLQRSLSPGLLPQHLSPRHRSDPSQPPLKISHREEITQAGKTPWHTVWVILLELGKWYFQQMQAFRLEVVFFFSLFVAVRLLFVSSWSWVFAEKRFARSFFLHSFKQPWYGRHNFKTAKKI